MRVHYGDRRVAYRTADPAGAEILRVPFRPRVLANGKPLEASAWDYGEYRGASGVLRIRRQGVAAITIVAEQGGR